MISTGDLGLDECLDGGYHQGSLYVVVGGVGSGKTSWVRGVIQRAINEKKSVHIVDPEGSLRVFEREPRCSFTTSDTDPRPTEVDLLVYDSCQLMVLPSWSASQPITARPALDRWVSDLTAGLRRLSHPIKLVSWQAPRSINLDDPNASLLPKRLNFEAEVVLRLRQVAGSIRATLRKNRFGSTGQEFGYTLPSVQPIIRKTRWEFLLQELDG